MRRDDIGFVIDETENSRPIALLTDLETGRQLLVGTHNSRPETDFPEPAIERARQILNAGFSQRFEQENQQYFVQVYTPSMRLLIVGAVHISQVLFSLAKTVGYETIVIDPRTAFASEIRFPDSDLLTQWPDEAMAQLKPDSRTAIVALSHDPKIDDPALLAALKSSAFYIGALGSRKTHQKRLKRLREHGVSEQSLGKIHSPVGLDIGSITPEEIAVSILAEITQELRRTGDAN